MVNAHTVAANVRPSCAAIMKAAVVCAAAKVANGQTKRRRPTYRALGDIRCGPCSLGVTKPLVMTFARRLPCYATRNCSDEYARNNAKPNNMIALA